MKYHLATLTSAAEHNFVKDFLIANTISGEYWLGGIQYPSDNPISNDGWEWITGEDWFYTNWHPSENPDEDEPNDWQGNDEFHLAMWSNYDWLWNDEHGSSNIAGYIAELTPVNVCIDIKPGSDPNSINLGSEGVVPVAILGSASFDVSTVDQSTVEFGGNKAREKGKSGKIGAFEDVNGDGITDLVLQFPVQDLGLTTDNTGEINGLLNDGTPIYGVDAIRVVPPDLEKPSQSENRDAVSDFSLLDNYPNPFNPTTHIVFQNSKDGLISLSIYNSRGEKIRSLVNGYYKKGVQTTIWDGKNDSGDQVGSGTYLMVLKGIDFYRTRKIVLMR